MNNNRSFFILTFLVMTISSGFLADFAYSDNDCPQLRNTLRAPKKIYYKKNPLRNSSENISIGEELFFKQRKELGCVRCHGVRGDGKGDMAAGLEPPPRNFSCARMMDKIPDGQLFWIIKNGSVNSGMYFYDKLKEKDVWRLILYIREFSK